MGQEVRPRVLLADDYPRLLTAWRNLLTPFCDVIGEVSDGRAVLEAAIALEPDVIVLDLSMPGMNGLDACRVLKGALTRTRIVIVTAAVGDPDLAEAAFDAGASAFVEKLSAYDDLPKAVYSVLAGEEYCTPFPGKERRGSSSRSLDLG